MKWIALPFLLLAMAGASAQQIGPAAASDTTRLRFDPDAKIQLRADPNLSFQSASSIIAPGSEDVCYTMHVIQFEARDGETPRKVGETTCTPARSQLKRAKRAPQARLVPAN
jgi:hypothetical protein